MVDLIVYTKLVGFQTILCLVKDGEIDTVYVCFACEDKDCKYDCLKPSDMLSLKYIIRKYSRHVVGWRVHHHHRNEFVRALANAIMKSNDEM